MGIYCSFCASLWYLFGFCFVVWLFIVHQLDPSQWPPMGTYCCSQFIVRRDRIVKNSPDFYQALAGVRAAISLLFCTVFDMISNDLSFWATGRSVRKIESVYTLLPSHCQNQQENKRNSFSIKKTIFQIWKIDGSVCFAFKSFSQVLVGSTKQKICSQDEEHDDRPRIGISALYHFKTKTTFFIFVVCQWIIWFWVFDTILRS